MNEEQWAYYMQLLAQSPNTSGAHCVSCWYEENTDELFPADDSSNLCPTHLTAIRAEYHSFRQQKGAHV